MMGKQAPQEAKLFYYDICLERRIPQKHLLRKIKDILDFDFVYPLVKDCYGKNGNVSVPQGPGTQNSQSPASLYQTPCTSVGMVAGLRAPRTISPK